MEDIFFPETNTMFPEIKRTDSFTNKVYFGETVRSMQHMSPVLQKPLVYAASKDITATYYIDAEVNKKSDITVISDVGTDKGFVEFIEKKVYYDKNADGQRNKDEYGFTLKIFISKDGNKITESYKASKAADDELLLFIEHGEDLFSSKKIYAKTGKAVFTYITVNDLYSKLKNYITDTKETSSETVEEINPLTVTQLKELLEKGYLESTYDVLKKVLSAISGMITFIPDLLGKALIQIGEWIDELVIPEEFWDTTDKKNVIAIDDTILKKIKEYAEKLKIGHAASGIIGKIEEVIRGFIAKYNAYVQTFTEENEFMTDQLAQKVAYVCGLWNGLVDFVSGTLKFFGEILSLPGKTTEEKEAVLEQLDNFIDLLLQTDLFDKLQQGFNTFIERIKKELQNGENELDWVRIHYIAGFAVAFIASFFIPIANLAKIEKLGKTGKLLSEILVGIGAKVAEAGKTLKETVQNSFVALLKALQEALELIAKGGSRFLDFFRDLAKKIVAWFLKNKAKIEFKPHLLVDAKEFVKLYTLTTAQHVNYGHVRIKKINPKLPKTDPKRIVEEYKYTPKRGKKGGGKFNYQIIVGGMHNLNNLNKYVRLKGELKLLGKLPTGEKVYEGMVEFYISELKQWSKAKKSTFFPKAWSENKIRTVIQEASMNIVYRDRNRYIGKTKNGIQIEFRLNLNTKEIETAFITFEKFN